LPKKPFSPLLTPSLVPKFIPWKNIGIFYLPPMIKFGNLEFVFAIKGSKLARRSVEDKLIKHKIGGLPEKASSP